MTPQRRQKIQNVLANRQTDITVVLENVFDPHNISAVMRSCDAVGIQDIYILNTRIPHHPKWGFRSSGSASKWLTVHLFTDVPTCVGALRSRYDAIFTTHLTKDAVSLYNLDLTGKIALVFGNEIEGISAEMLASADGNMNIPQVGMIESLNISVACAVSLYEAFRQKTAAGHYQQPKLHTAERNNLLKTWGLEHENL